MDYILLLLLLTLFLFMWSNYENFCADSFIEMIGSMEPVNNKNKRNKTTPTTAPVIVKKCCPNTGGFSVVVYGDRPTDSNCCLNFRKTISKNDRAQFKPLPKAGAGFCTSILP